MIALPREKIVQSSIKSFVPAARLSPFYKRFSRLSTLSCIYNNWELRVHERGVVFFCACAPPDRPINQSDVVWRSIERCVGENLFSQDYVDWIWFFFICREDIFFIYCVSKYSLFLCVSCIISRTITLLNVRKH